MKFGKFIQSVAAEWASPHYLNYKALKKIIGAVDDDDLPQPIPQRSATGSAEQPPDPPAPRTHLPDPPPSPGSQAVKTAFFFTLERELEKINSFYIQKEAEFKVRLRSLLDKKRILSTASTKAARSSRAALRDAFIQFQTDLAKLQKFVEVNATGFRKILKKWDKRAKSSTKELYLSRQIEIQPCFNNDVLADLTDIATNNLADLDKMLEGMDADEFESTDPSTANRRIISGDSALDAAETELSKLLTDRNHAAVVDFLVRHPPASIAADDPQFFSRLFLRFCASTSIECLRDLLSTSHVSINSVDDVNDRSCLHEAAIAGRLDVLILALESGSTLDSPDVYGRRPLHYAAMYGHPDCALHLLDAGTPVDIVDHDGYSPLVYAVLGSHTKCVKIFIDHNATIEPLAPTAPIPLSLACKFGNNDIVLLLLEHGASLVSDTDGLNPLHMACREGHAEAAKLLIAHGADLEAKDSFNGWTPVFFSASEGHFECIQALIAAGCRINIKDDTGWLPWTYALYRGHIQVASLLAVQDTFSDSTDPNVAKSNVSGASSGHRPLDVANLGAESPSQRTVSAATTTITGASIIPTIGSEMANDPLDVSMDDIPMLSLPPPIIPFRIYGHSYLEKKSHLEIQLGSHLVSAKSSSSPIRLFNSRQLTSLKLIISSYPDDGVPHSVILPLKDDLEVFSFMVDESQDFSIQFDIYPTFGTKVIGRAVFLKSQIEQVISKSVSGAGEPESVICPLFDTRLHVVGEISFEVSMVRPFAHAGLKIGGKIETYWKSTKVIAGPSSATKTTALSSSIINSATGTVVAGGGISASSSMAVVGHVGSGFSGLGVSGIFGGSTAEAVHSLITASSLAEEYIQLEVQMTKDRIPVVFPDWAIVMSGVRIPVSQLTFEQAKSLFEASTSSQSVSGLKDLLQQQEPSYLTNNGRRPPLSNLVRIIYTALLTLEDVLMTLPASIGVHIALKYPTSIQRAYLGIPSDVSSSSSSSGDMNTFVDAVLTTVYNSANQRSIIFSSFNPSVCTMINWKQPNYGVFFCTYCGFVAETMSVSQSSLSLGATDCHEGDRRCMSIKEAIKFAKSSNFLGLMCKATPLVQTPVLITTIKESGLLLASFGAANQDPQSVRVQEQAGVDGIIVDRVFKYNSSS